MRQGLCNGTLSVRLSRLSSVYAAAAGLLPWSRRTRDIDRQRRPPGVAGARRTAADIGSSRQTCGEGHEGHILMYSVVLYLITKM